MRYLVYLVLTLILINGSLLNAQQLSLQECIELGIENNLQVKSQKLEKEIDLPAKLSAYGQFMPTVSAGYGINQHHSTVRTYVADDGRVITLPIRLPDGEYIPVQERKNRNSSYYLQVNELFFDGGRSWYNLKNVKLSETIRDVTIDQKKLDTRSLITTAYCAALAAQKYLELTHEVIELRRKQLRYAKARLEAGSAIRRDVLQSELELSRSISDSMDAARDAQNTLHDLNLVIGTDVDKSWELIDLPDIFEPSWDSGKLVDFATSNHYAIKSAELNHRIARNNIKANQGDYLPQISGSISYNRSEQSGTQESFTLDPRNKSTTYGLNLNWTVFDRFSRSLRLQDARIHEQQVEIEIQELKNRITRNISAIINDLNSIYKQVDVRQKNVELAEETLKFEEERYKIGSGTTLELRTAQLSYTQAKVEHINLKTNFYIKLGELEAATGKHLRDINR